jgi:DNA-binding transcriptional MerR regulator
MAIYMIGDLITKTGLPRDTVNYYLREGLIEPVDRSERNRYRYFDDTTLERLNRIISLRKQGISIRQIKKQLREE